MLDTVVFSSNSSQLFAHGPSLPEPRPKSEIPRGATCVHVAPLSLSRQPSGRTTIPFTSQPSNAAAETFLLFFTSTQTVVLEVLFLFHLNDSHICQKDAATCCWLVASTFFSFPRSSRYVFFLPNQQQQKEPKPAKRNETPEKRTSISRKQPLVCHAILPLVDFFWGIAMCDATYVRSFGRLGKLPFSFRVAATTMKYVTDFGQRTRNWACHVVWHTMQLFCRIIWWNLTPLDVFLLQFSGRE